MKHQSRFRRLSSIAILAVVAAILGLILIDFSQRLRAARANNDLLQNRIEQESTALLESASLFPGAPRPTMGPAVPGHGQLIEDLTQSDATERLQDRILTELTNPENKADYVQRAQRILARQFPELGEVLRLAPSEVDSLLNLLARQRTEAAINALPPSSGAAALRPQDVTAIAEDRNLRNENEIRELLGEKYPEWKDYQKSIPTRRQIDVLRAKLGSGVDSLSAEQESALIRELTTEQSRFQHESEQLPGGFSGNRREMLEKRLLSVASIYLTPTQLAIYRGLLEQN